MFLYLYLNLPCIIINFTKMNFIIIEFNFSQRPKNIHAIKMFKEE